MPADHKNPSSCRRASRRKLTSDEEIELKRSRARGEISCAECKRSKLKCDKNIPCGSCALRGRSDICPNGISPPSQTTNLVIRTFLPDMEYLHRKIFEMGQRILQLEDALAILQSNVSSEPHALLVEQLLSVKSAPDGSSVQDKEDLEETLKSFGTLTIGDSGEHTYFGASAGSEACSTPPAEEFDPNGSLGGSPDLLKNIASMSFFGGGCAADSETFKSAMTMLFAGLPPRPRASSLCETYLEHSCWYTQLATRQDLIEDVLTPVYNAKKAREDPACDWEHCAQISPHKLAFLYLVFAQAVLVDLTVPAYHVDGETYHHYASAAMALRPLFDSPTVETVQAILLMTYYRSCAGERYTLESIWALGSLGCKLAQSVSWAHFSAELLIELFTDRDPGQWHMDGKTVELRRRIFWEVYTADLFHSLIRGRPPSIELTYVDCAFPTCDEEDYDAQYWNWKYQFIRDVFGSAVQLTLAAAPPSYKLILELDRKARETVLPPPALNKFLRTEDAQAYVSAGVHMKSFLLSSYRSCSMVFIHRSFFAQALLDHPESPLRSPYATSFLATYRAASFVISSTAKYIERYPELFLRHWVVWTQLFSAAIIVGSIATKAPSSSLASTAFAELGLAVDLYERGVNLSERTRTGLAILQKLQEKASLAQCQHHNSTDGPPSAPLILNGQEDGTDELALFGGQTSVLISKTPARKTSSSHITSNLNAMAGSAISSSCALPSPSPWPDQGILQDIHPSLVQYASLLPPATLSTDFTGHPAPYFEPQSLDQSNVDVPVAWNAQIPSHPQAEIPSLAVPDGFTNGPTPCNFFQELYQETHATTLDTWGSNDMTDLGQMMNIDGDMDAQWMSFMKESGIVNPTTFGA
ncbi:hypothetical protein FIBSPDRAFT_745533 [Athelia psychrophila]|uniref:Zn(2)-C6 fungal-type domain-containing protein n=1 Tax=Athelia psychrophila TaxID=1759441 RepID=A0A166H0V2_9AGAM|nr:hypothetical protein FIBSPDRAFT_745533 [Fibularhizoctonia sp. CBS 109695]